MRSTVMRSCAPVSTEKNGVLGRTNLAMVRWPAPLCRLGDGVKSSSPMGISMAELPLAVGICRDRRAPLTSEARCKPESGGVAGAATSAMGSGGGARAVGGMLVRRAGADQVRSVAGDGGAGLGGGAAGSEGLRCTTWKDASRSNVAVCLGSMPRITLHTAMALSCRPSWA
jgi:hypothetical protein